MKKKPVSVFSDSGFFSEKRLRERSVRSDEGIRAVFRRFFHFGLYELNGFDDVFGFAVRIFPDLSKSKDDRMVRGIGFFFQYLKLGEFLRISAVSERIEDFYFSKEGLDFRLPLFRELDGSAPGLQIGRKAFEQGAFRGGGVPHLER